MGGVGRDVARLVVGVEDEVHPRNVIVWRIDPHLVGEVAAHVEVRVLGDLVVILVLQAVDEGGQHRQLGHQVAGILEHRVPVVHLRHALVVALDEERLALHGEDAGRVHGHRMGVAGMARSTSLT